MTSLSHADFRYAICNWEPQLARIDARRKERERRLRVIKPKEERVQGVQINSGLRTFVMREDAEDKRVDFAIAKLDNAAMEMTPYGPEIYTNEGIDLLADERRRVINVIVKDEGLDEEHMHRIAECAFADGSQFSLFYMVVNESARNVWEVAEYGDVLDLDYLTGLNAEWQRTLYVLTTNCNFDRDINAVEKDGYKLSFIAPEEWAARNKIELTEEIKSGPPFNLLSRFRCQSKGLSVITIENDRGKRKSYNTLISTGFNTASITHSSREDAVKAHAELVRAIVEEGAPYVRRLFTEHSSSGCGI